MNIKSLNVLLKKFSNCRKLNPRYLRWYFFKKWFPNKLFVAKLGFDNHKILLSASDALAYSIYWYRRSEPVVFDFVKKVLQPGMVVIDVGANIGQYTLLAAQCVGNYGQVHSFEPATREYAILYSNVKLNKITNAFLQKKAVSKINGYAFINTFSGGMGAYNTLGQPTHHVVNGLTAQKEQVESISLDSYLVSNSINQVDLIKIDVEGGEIDVLNGASNLLTSEDSPMIICEFGDETLAGFNRSGKELHTCFENYGYVVTEIMSESMSLRPIKHQSEYGANYVAIKPNHLSKWGLTLLEKDR